MNTPALVAVVLVLSTVIFVWCGAVNKMFG